MPRKKSPVTPTGIYPGTFRLVAQCLNHYATPGPDAVCKGLNNDEKCPLQIIPVFNKAIQIFLSQRQDKFKIFTFAS
jgi:hypothetical protein